VRRPAVLDRAFLSVNLYIGRTPAEPSRVRRIMAGPTGRCDVSETADRDDRSDAKHWLDVLTKKEEHKLIELLRKRFPDGGAEGRREE